MMENVLFKNIFLAQLNQVDLNLLQRYWHKRDYCKGETILKQGQPGVGLFLISKGSVTVISEFPGSQELIFAELKEGDFFGEVSLLDGGPCTASVIAVSKTTCLFLDKNVLMALELTLPDIAHKLICTLGLYSIHRLRNLFDSLPGLLKGVAPEFRNTFANRSQRFIKEKSILRLANTSRLPGRHNLLEFDTFEAFTEQEMKQFLEFISVVVIKNNIRLFAQTDAAGCLFYIIEGSTQLAYDMGGIQIKLDVMGPGRFIGALPYFDGLNQGLSCVVREYAQMLVIRFDHLATMREVNDSLYNKFYFELTKSVVVLLRSINKQLLRIQCELELSPLSKHPDRLSEI